MELYPWHKQVWARLAGNPERFPHALLLHGPAGVGKRGFARCLAQAKLCCAVDAAGLACGSCISCHWFAQATHPDFRLITSEAESVKTMEATEEGAESSQQRKASNQILIDPIRELGMLFQLSTQRGGMRVIIIQPAEVMNASAANALLKVLEEPPADTLLILVSDQRQRLLPTIQSRCHAVAMPLPEAAVARQWLRSQGLVEQAGLALAGGAPLLALACADAESNTAYRGFVERLCSESDPVALAEHALKLGPAIVIDWLQKWVYDLASFGLFGVVRYHADFEAYLSAASKKADLRSLLRYQALLLETKRAIHLSLNHQLVLEDAFLGYMESLEIRP
ncbi:MAG: DNA polymerase III subunit delta' [Burkholderiales bacterium]